MSIGRRAKSLLEPGEGLYQRTVRSGGWVLMFRITERVFSIARLVIVARVLAPNDFGLMGIALLAMATVETFSRTGLEAALIQKRGRAEDYLDAVWTVSAVRGIVLFVVLFFAATYVALFFNAPAATSIIRATGVASLLRGLTNPGVIYFQKELDFSKQFLYEMTGTIADFAVVISAALILKSAWALVFGLLAGHLVRLIASYLLYSYRPRLSSDLGKAKELFGFGKWVLVSSMIVFLAGQGDDILVGKMFAVTALGFYQMAYRLSNAPATEITHVISRVSFPAYSKLQHNLPSLRQAYLKTLQLTASMSIPLAGGMFVLAPEFTRIFLGQEWMPMVPAMQVLALFGLLRSIGATIGPLLRAIGKPRIDATMQFIQLCILAALIYPLSARYHILGTSIAVTIPFLVMIGIGLSVCARNIRARVSDLARLLFNPLAGSTIMIMTIMFLKTHLLGSEKSLLEFFILISVGIGVYGGFMLWRRDCVLAEIREVIRGILR